MPQEANSEQKAIGSFIAQATQGGKASVTVIQQAPIASNPREKRNRKQMLRKVHNFWIDGVLAQSLYKITPLVLGLEWRPQAVALPWDIVIQRPKSVAQRISRDTTILDVFNDSVGELLILGMPGSGKTTMLLTLARDLLTLSENDEEYPIPVIFNLSSWANKRKTIDEWLVDELLTRYDVPHAVGKSWIENDVVLPLLDGLDEVLIEYRELCVEALNSFRKDHGLVNIVVCSRIQDYEMLNIRLKVDTAVLIQPLTKAQIREYFSNSDQQFDIVEKAFFSNAFLFELAKSPLMLNVIYWVFRNNPNLLLDTHVDPSELQKELFNIYVDQMFNRREATSHFSRRDTEKWLSWLARLMTNKGQSIFFIESLQPEWFSLHIRQQYRIMDRVFAALFVAILMAAPYMFLVVCYGYITERNFDSYTLFYDAMAFGMFGILIGGFFGGSTQVVFERKADLWHAFKNAVLSWLSVGLVCSLILGPSVGLAFGWIGGFVGGIAGPPHLQARRIQVVEVLRWSWSSSLRALAVGLIGGVAIGLINGYFFYKSFDGIGGELLSGSFQGFVFATGISIIFLLVGSLRGAELDTKIAPNQGIRRSINSAITAAIIGGIVTYLILTLAVPGTLSGVIIGTICGCIAGLVYGGYASISHFTIRFILWLHQLTPWRLAEFLNYAENRIFLRRAGGGYIFMHRLLLDYFANLAPKTDGDAEEINLADLYANIVKYLQSYKNRSIQVVFGIFTVVISFAILFFVLDYPRATLTDTSISILAPQIPDDKFITLSSSKTISDYLVVDDIYIEIDDIISVSANGFIEVGPWAGNITPEGTERGYLGIPLGDSYDIVDEFPTGALMCRISSQAAWQLCGSNSLFRSKNEGKIELKVNDNEPWVHRGYFHVSIDVFKRMQ